MDKHNMSGHITQSFNDAFAVISAALVRTDSPLRIDGQITMTTGEYLAIIRELVKDETRATLALSAMAQLTYVLLSDISNAKGVTRHQALRVVRVELERAGAV